MSSAPLHILLADDDEADRLLFKEAIREVGFPVNLTVLNGGEQLIDFLQSEMFEMPDLVFLDLNMPRKNGFECLREIRETKKLQSMPVIIFSTSDEESGVDQTFEDGAQLYVVKPPDFPHLVQSIQQAVLLSEKPGFLKPVRSDFVLNVSTAR
jgi:CheY-like chemotaxis protein